MSDATLQKIFIDKGCYPHQAQFAAAFFATDAPRKHLLVSAPGMGKVFASTAIINHALSSGEAHRVLVLTPSALRAQWQERIQRGDPGVPVTMVDRRRLRELEDSQPVGDEIFPANAVVILSLDFAKQIDAAAALTRFSWDLLVVDEVHLASPQTQRAKVLLDLMNDCPRMRVLLLGGPWIEGEIVASAKLYRDAKVTVWNRETLRDHQGKPLLPEVRMIWITYRRREGEAEVLAQFRESLRSLDLTDARMRLVAATLLQSASSSPFALEQRLRRIRQRRNELVHGVGEDQETESDAVELGIGDPVVGDTGALLKGYVELAKVSDPLLKLLDELPTDSKCEALVRLLDSVGTTKSPDRRVCVFTRFVDTATYLENVLRETFPLVRVVTGSHSLAAREQIIADFTRYGGVLIATESIEEPSPEVAAVVFYDLPWNPAVLEARIGQFVRVGRRNAIQLFAFTDESNALVFERLQKKIVDIKETLSDQEIDQVLFSNDSK